MSKYTQRLKEAAAALAASIGTPEPTNDDFESLRAELGIERQLSPLDKNTLKRAWIDALSPSPSEE